MNWFILFWSGKDIFQKRIFQPPNLIFEVYIHAQVDKSSIVNKLVLYIATWWVCCLIWEFVFIWWLYTKTILIRLKRIYLSNLLHFIKKEQLGWLMEAFIFCFYKISWRNNIVILISFLLEYLVDFKGCWRFVVICDNMWLFQSCRKIKKWYKYEAILLVKLETIVKHLVVIIQSLLKK